MSDEKPAEPSSRRKILRRAALVGIVLTGMTAAVVLGAYATLLFTLRGHEVVVPDLTKMTQAEAQTAAAERQLGIEVAGTRSDPRVSEGRVLDQDPPPGSRTRPQRRIRVTLAGAQEAIDVPAFAGETLRMVQLRIGQGGLRLGRISWAPSPDQPADQIIAQRPAPGARRQKGDAVDLLVSTGRADRLYVMPSLAGLDAERATDLLAGGGVRAGITKRPAPEGKGAGIVLEQKPLEGHPVQERQTVRLVVSE